MRSPLAVFTILLAISLPATGARAKDKKPIDQSVVVALITRGDIFAAHHDYGKALSAYNKAEKTARHTCPICLLREFQIERAVGNLNDALDDAKKAVKEAGADKAMAAEAHLARGVLLGEMTSNPKDKRLVQAMAEAQLALALDPSIHLGHFDLGFLMLKRRQDAQGIAELRTYLASNDPDVAANKLARELIADPRRAREPIAPDFTLTTLDGGQISLDSLHGKVALLDFWGTWCPPCRASVPTLISLHKKFDGQPVEFVGISSDTDQAAWRKFVATHHMDWPEYIDLSGDMQAEFTVHEFPTYVVIDGDGMIRFRQSGYGDATFVDLEGAIHKALKEKPAKDAASASATAKKGKP
ncbi:MAG TPA: redoxin domain-containing protein [Candidatus Limnocylindrales bacterium]|nr:redoxin domain-containing protein [Candidatus Limnocylindrales bacterium]